jgi:hypothetical protein
LQPRLYGRLHLSFLVSASSASAKASHLYLPYELHPRAWILFDWGCCEISVASSPWTSSPQLLYKCLQEKHWRCFYCFDAKSFQIQYTPSKRWGSVVELTCHLQGSTPYGIRFFHKTYRPSPTKDVSYRDPLLIRGPLVGGDTVQSSTQKKVQQFV